MTFDAEPARRGPKCSECGSLRLVEWIVYDRNSRADRRFCHAHVPPLGTPRITRYRYFGAIRHEQEKDFEPGERVTINLGGKVSRGTILEYDGEHDGWTVDWDGWMIDTGFPSHWLNKLSPLQQLADVAPEEPAWKKYHRY
jgi:hypothetical protein